MARIIHRHYLPLPDPSDGELHIRMTTRGLTPSGFAVHTLHDYSVEFLFNPLYDLDSLERAFSFFSTKLAAHFGLGPRFLRQIAHQMAKSAYDYVSARGWRYGLSMSTQLETVHALEEQRPPQPPAEFLDGNLIFNDTTHLKKQLFNGNEKGESCCVCLEEFSEGAVITPISPCSHMFHNECIAKWLMKNRTCPICRSGSTLV